MSTDAIFYQSEPNWTEPQTCLACQNHAFRRTNVIEVNHWAKVANKTANINVQNRSFYASLRRHCT